jgi:hypothetical protein
LEDFEMGETGQIPNRTKRQGMFLALVGIVLVIVGAAIITIPGAPGRGSGIGTVSVVLGFLVLGLGLFRFISKRA